MIAETLCNSLPCIFYFAASVNVSGVKALTDISFDCYAGQVALMGENGAGKSTLATFSGNYAPTTGSSINVEMRYNKKHS